MSLSERPCKRGHNDRYPNGRCRACANLRAAEWAKNNPDRAKANWASSYARPERKEVERAYYLANREVAIARATKANSENPERRLLYNQKWTANNRDKRAMYNVSRRAAVQIATPAWADKAEIAFFYAEAQRKTVETGTRYSVDHVIPLKGKTVCGLHVQFNLAVIPFADNCRKGASYGTE